MIKTIIIEEHNEAFFVWNNAVKEKIIPPKNSCLLHFDSHADIDLPSVSTSLNKNELTLKEIYDLTYNQLDLQNFITPCIYREMFNEVYWYQPDFCKKKKGTLHVWSDRNLGKQLYMSMSDKGVPNQKKCSYLWKNPSYDFESASDSFILDIDIDFFLCEDEPVPLKIETTHDEYLKYKSNRLHPLRFSMGNSVKAEENEGKYYFIFELPDDPGIGGPKSNPARLLLNKKMTEKKQVPAEELLKGAEKKVKMMTDFLTVNKITPLLINICRSHYSGYTPQKYSDQIQEMVIKALNSLYKLDIMHMDDLLKAKGLY